MAFTDGLAQQRLGHNFNLCVEQPAPRKTCPPLLPATLQVATQLAPSHQILELPLILSNF